MPASESAATVHGAGRDGRNDDERLMIAEEENITRARAVNALIDFEIDVRSSVHKLVQRCPTSAQPLVRNEVERVLSKALAESRSLFSI